NAYFRRVAVRAGAGSEYAFPRSRSARGSAGVGSSEAVTQGEGSRLGAVVGVRLGEDMANMDLDGALAEEEGFGDVAVCLPRDEESQDLDLTRGEACGIRWTRQRHPVQAGGEGRGTGERGPGCEWGADVRHHVEEETSSVRITGRDVQFCLSKKRQ